MSDFTKDLKWLLGDKDVYVVDDEEDMGFGFNPWNRPEELYIRYGIVNLDKPPGPTSHQVTTWVKRILEVSKAGHGGTLDPMVTGVLPIGIEKSTLVMRYIVGSVKEYVGVMRLHDGVDPEAFERVFNLFRGRIYQKPPVRSSVRRRIRTRTVYSSEILDIVDRDILFRIECESGFYVRKYVHDIGLVLGIGAHMTELRRTRAGPFTENDHFISLYDLASAVYLWRNVGDFSLMREAIIPLEYILKMYPLIVIKDSAVASIIYGAQLKVPGVLAYTSDIRKNGRVGIITKKGELVAIAISQYDSNELSSVERGVVAVTERVVMEKGLYPPMWKPIKQ